MPFVHRLFADLKTLYLKTHADLERKGVVVQGQVLPDEAHFWRRPSWLS